MFYPASGIQINYLEPLKKWRILNLKNLMGKANYELGYVGFTKMMSNLEKKNLIGSFRDPYTRKKYLYLTNEGNSYLGGGSKSPAISKETLVHDSKVVEIVLGLLALKSFYGFELEHNMKQGDGMCFGSSVLPDSLMLGEKDGKKFKLALELELSRKVKERYLGKASEYLKSDYYNFVIYFFQNKGVLNSYRKHIRSKFGESSDAKIIYVLNEKILSKEFKFEDSIAFLGEREGRLNALF